MSKLVAQHPLKSHEAALRVFLGLRSDRDTVPRGNGGKPVEDLYETLVKAASDMGRRVGLKRHRESAREAVHELFCQLRPVAADRLDFRKPVYPYVYRALRNIVLRMRYRPAFGFGAGQSAGVDFLTSDPFDPIAGLVADEATGFLSASLQTAVRHWFYLGEDGGEAGRALGVAATTVHVRVHRAVRRLRKIYKTD